MLSKEYFGIFRLTAACNPNWEFEKNFKDGKYHGTKESKE
jgi:hypothetical protein